MGYAEENAVDIQWVHDETGSYAVINAEAYEDYLTELHNEWEDYLYEEAVARGEVEPDEQWLRDNAHYSHRDRDYWD